MQIKIDSWVNGAAIPEKFAFGKIPIEGRFALSSNVNPGIAWSGAPEGTNGLTGINSYTDWFAEDTEMAGNYGGYDGPCPPWNDSILHHYYFTVYALDVEKLDLDGAFTGSEALAAFESHVLAKASHMGTYSMNPKVPSE